MLMQRHLPDRLYYKIGEVADIVGVKPYVLRYWETEFPEISPIKSRSFQRLYKRHDIAMIAAIRDLLYKNKYTIKGAKGKIKELRRQMVAADTVRMAPDSNGSQGLGGLCVDEIKTIVGEMEGYLERN